MELSNGLSLLILGLFLLAGYLAHIAGPRISIPRVTILLVVGALVGPSVLDIVPESISRWFPLISHMALAMVGFLLGERFVLKELRKRGPTVLWISIGETVAAAGLVAAALALAGAPPPLAILLAGIAPASAPAAIFETVREGEAKGPLTDTLLGVVAIDDAWGVIVFSVLFVVAQASTGSGAHMAELGGGLWEVSGAVLLGAAVGFPMAWITRRVREGEPTLVEAAGFVFLCTGLAGLLGVSYLLSAMVLGAVVANFSPDQKRPFRAIEGVSEPFLAIFFLLAGFRLELASLPELGLIGAVYILARAGGLVLGGLASGRLVGAPGNVSSRIGFCILPQAGVALGFALLAKERMPEIGTTVLHLVIATTVLFELTGPLIARWQLSRAGELPGSRRSG